MRSSSLLKLDPVLTPEFLTYTKNETVTDEPAFTLPSEVKEFKSFMTSENGQLYREGVNQLCENLEEWGTANGLGKWGKAPYDRNLNQLIQLFYQNHFATIDPLTEQAREYGTSIYPLYTVGISQLHTFFSRLQQNSIPLDKRKEVFKNLIEGLGVCAPGVVTNISNANLALATKLSEIVMRHKRAIAENAVMVLIRESALQQDEDIGMETHQVASILNYYADQLGLEVKEDNFAIDIQSTNIITPISQFILQKFPDVIANNLTAENIVELLADDLMPEILKILHTVNSDEIVTQQKLSEKMNDINEALSLYGKDENFISTNFLELDQDALVDGEYKFIADSKRIKDIKEIKSLLMTTLLHRVASNTYFDIQNIKRITLNSTAELCFLSNGSNFQNPKIYYINSYGARYSLIEYMTGEELDNEIIDNLLDNLFFNKENIEHFVKTYSSEQINAVFSKNSQSITQYILEKNINIDSIFYIINDEVKTKMINIIEKTLIEQPGISLARENALLKYFYAKLKEKQSIYSSILRYFTTGNPNNHLNDIDLIKTVQERIDIQNKINRLDSFVNNHVRNEISNKLVGEILDSNAYYLKFACAPLIISSISDQSTLISLFSDFSESNSNNEEKSEDLIKIIRILGNNFFRNTLYDEARIKILNKLARMEADFIPPLLWEFFKFNNKTSGHLNGLYAQLEPESKLGFQKALKRVVKGNAYTESDLWSFIINASGNMDYWKSELVIDFIKTFDINGSSLQYLLQKVSPHEQLILLSDPEKRDFVKKLILDSKSPIQDLIFVAQKLQTTDSLEYFQYFIKDLLEDISINDADFSLLIESIKKPNKKDFLLQENITKLFIRCIHNESSLTSIIKNLTPDEIIQLLDKKSIESHIKKIIGDASPVTVAMLAYQTQPTKQLAFFFALNKSYSLNMIFNDNTSEKILSSLPDSVCEVIVEDYIKIYYALRAGQGSLFKTDWVKSNKVGMNSPKDDLKLIIGHALKSPKSRTAEAIRLAFKHAGQPESPNLSIDIHISSYARSNFILRSTAVHSTYYQKRPTDSSTLFINPPQGSRRFKIDKVLSEYNSKIKSKRRR